MAYISLNREDVFELDFEIEKGQTVEPVYITAEGENFQDSLVFAEIRRKPFGKSLISPFTASVNSGSDRVTLAYHGDRNMSKDAILSQLDIKAGDEVIVEGSGINGAIVRTVSNQFIEVNQLATRSVTDARLFASARIDSSFVAGASGSIFTIGVVETTVVEESTVVTVNNFKERVNQGSKLIFSAGGTNLEVTLAADARAGQSTITLVGQPAIDSSYVSHCGVFTIITNGEISLTSTSVQVDPILANIPANHQLYFGYRNEMGWRYAGRCKTTAIAIKGSGVLQISDIQIEPYLNGTIPRNSIAWFGSFPFERFYIAIDTRDMLTVTSGRIYGYDVMKWKQGVISKLGGGKIIFKDNFTEVYE